ncbi:trifunctional transcriptional regulator/proline dehydrogenase/L-glutamate gamma-semialdehyde dehydrogenase [Achromobacter animicus]|uniref:trifunctional transcriptional regulator/proline dehydrogenase/L-glutamate gamma-semialdehyde dehydrogenase n=2 Tax=Achromobacter TaxID=222 RepID=UPI00244B399B|nr:trifunctional transcriptional regulator/proline dehydrogenase/L-glutamate gamma-semialdehyde dehydrogenase [Achromobacter animicus]MDH0683054.1 trifunctional transcriptional regulator/proline dehydrogenase/L-glutamate gamma-semialdehyde dehydrogenase [Achromobacter animicus]
MKAIRSAITPIPDRSALRSNITPAWRVPEPTLVPMLIDSVVLSPTAAMRSQELATRIVTALRERKSTGGKSGLVQGLLQEFSLSSQEGVALMCLAEALLRIPDTATRDALIRDKIKDGNWEGHVGQSPSAFVNAAAWGLMLTGKLVSTHSEKGMKSALARLVAKGGEPLIRKGVDVAMRMMGEQFVTGETIEDALKNAQSMEKKGFKYSYDMLGEAAMTSHDAKRYLADYEQAIHAIGKASAGQGVYEGPGISIKLSALHPRYSRAQLERAQSELYPVLLGLAKLARHYDIGLNIDAEESDRLELSLDLLERLCFDEALSGWQGIGFVIQAYQKRCPALIDYLVDLASRSKRRLMIRLVKGAYWDTEIKRAQVDGLEDYPVYTRKAYTDIAYLACAKKLLSAPDQIYPQFATHNAQTLATIYEMAEPHRYQPGQYEFQCLHGMGEPLYEQVVGASPDKLGRPCRIYAPVGTHETLLAYLVRRLLENGANTSFVNRVADKSISVKELVQDPVNLVQEWARKEGQLGMSHPGIVAPGMLYGMNRVNALGTDLANEVVLARLGQTLELERAETQQGGPLLAQEHAPVELPPEKVVNPADHSDVIGYVRAVSTQEITAAISRAEQFSQEWARVEPNARAAALLRASDLMEAQTDRLLILLVREAGKTCANAVAEVREAVDFLRYYAAQVRADFSNATHRPLGPVTCISPWNFPLAIFTGQVAAALAAGNTVLAKPAEQTTLIAIEAVRFLWEGGIPKQALQLIPGRGKDVGPALIEDARIQGVMFTGSTEVARHLQRSLAGRLRSDGAPIPFIAETGGQNAMIVDSSALAEQVVQDVVMSAFDSAGQRCSALRVLCVQDDVADSLVQMLEGAMQELRVGPPEQLCNDVGPVIDARARDTINAHIASMKQKGRRVIQLSLGGEAARQAVERQGTYVPPTLIEIESLSELKREVFGPVLHLLRYRRSDLDQVLTAIANTKYGLTMGVHTRIDETIAQISSRANVGNLYINRNMVGAVVGVQPFGGEGLSGTGPKAGGPLYLYRLLAQRPDQALQQPFGVEGREQVDQRSYSSISTAYESLMQWGRAQGYSYDETPYFCTQGAAYSLRGPTGESNVYEIHARQAVYCQADNASDLQSQLAAVLRVGATAVWNASSSVASQLYQALPDKARQSVRLSRDVMNEQFDAALCQGDEPSVRRLVEDLAAREGEIVSVTYLRPGEIRIPLERLVIERSVSTNTAAAGGNASLMTMA